MVHRTMCDALDEMRTCTKTLNFSYLLGLIEEVQVMGNRMEAALEDRKTEAWKLKKEIEKHGGPKAPKSEWDDE